VVALWPQALKNKSYCCTALLNGRFAAVQNGNGPIATGAQGDSFDDSALIRRGFVLEYLPLVPTFARGTRGDQLQGPYCSRVVSRPGRGDRRFRIRRLTVADGKVGIDLRRTNYDEVFAGRDRPAGRCRKRCAPRVTREASAATSSEPDIATADCGEGALAD
jgi:hypothetical protein